MSSRTVEISSVKGCISVDLEEGEPKPFKMSNAEVNTSHAVMMQQLRHNLRLQLPQLRVTEKRDEELCILCGGPSMLDFVDEIKERVTNGAKTLVLNGAHDWAASVGITRHFYAMIDQRESSTKFVENSHPGITYIISSSCHPRVFELLRERRVFIYHCAGSKARLRAVRRYYLGAFVPFVEGGSTVGTRSFMIGRYLGFDRFHVYGYDACVLGTKHHAYPQALNDDNTLEVVRVGDREFLCQGWMVDQAREFFSFMDARGHLFKMQIHGDGLVAYLMEWIGDEGKKRAALSERQSDCSNVEMVEGV